MYNINIERAVLSAIIFNDDETEVAISRLKKEDFYLPFHQEMFESMDQLLKEEIPIDEEFLKIKLTKKNKYQEQSMLNVIATTPITNVVPYIEELKKKSKKRSLASLANEIKKEITEKDQDSDEVLNIIEKKIFEIVQGDSQNEFKNAEDVGNSTLEEILRMQNAPKGTLLGVDTGFRNLNEKTSGFGRGDLVILAARPAMGKTSLVLNMATSTLDRNEGVAFFSLEMPSEQLMLRMISSMTSINLQALRNGEMSTVDFARVEDAINELKTKKLFIDDGGNATIHQIRSKLRKLKLQHPEITIAFIDYLQLMTGDGKSREGRQQEISEISRGLKQLARELDMPIVALSQLNRSVESRDNKRPMLSDLRESGAIEQDADIILFVYREAVYKEAMEKEKKAKAEAEGKDYTPQIKIGAEEDAELIIGKQRNGPTGTVRLVFQKKFTKFVDASPMTAGIEIIYEGFEKEFEINDNTPNIEMPTL